MSQKGGVVLILLIIVIALGVAAGIYLISGGTSFFPNASSPNKQYGPEPTPYPSISTTTTEDSNYENPFGEEYENPFNNL